MSGLCASNYWDWNLTWYSDSFPDFTLCFEETALVWLPSLILVVISFTELPRFLRNNNDQPPLPFTIFWITKISLAGILALLSLVELIGEIIDMTDGDRSAMLAENFTPLIKLCTFIYVMVILHFHRKYRVHSSGVLFIFWLVFTIGATLNYRTLLNMVMNNGYEFDGTIDEMTFIIKMISYPIIVLQLFLSCFADYMIPTKDKNPCPETSASFLSRLSFWWFNQMVFTGYKKPLTPDDMWDLVPDNQTKNVMDQFDKIWLPTVQKSKEEAMRKTPTGDMVTTDVNIAVSIIKLYGLEVLFVSLLKLVASILTFANPLVLDYLIAYVTPNSTEPVWRGYFYAGLMFVSPLFESIFNGQFEYLNAIIMMKIRSCIITTIYKKSLKLSSYGRKNFTTGEIVNLMAVDSQRIMDFLALANYLWSAPLQIVIALVMLWQQLGIATMAGVAFMVVLMPINYMIASKMKGMFMSVMKMKDKRVKLMNEILNGIKVFKLYAWETSFQEQVMKFRELEVKSIKQTAYYSAVMTFSFTSAPFFVGLFSFMAFILMSSDNILDANKAFVSLSLFNILRLPLAFLPNLFSFGAGFLVSIKRVNEFLNVQEIDETAIGRRENRETPVVVENASFKWGKDSPTVLKNISIRVKRNKLVAVVGQVGSGKSSLLSALLGDLDKSKGIVNVSGNIAYVPQQAWIQNSTLRQNILFTNKYNEKFYNKVIESCALEQDLKILSAGDMTEIGEKGINLSGGQKQRVSLARAVYSNADVYLLDDPLSAVDAHVSRHLFEQVIGPDGILKHKTRILVTHRASVLTNVDQIIVLKEGTISEMGTFEELIANNGDFSEFVAEYVLQQQTGEEVNEDELQEIEEFTKKVKPFIERSISVFSDRSRAESDIRRRYSMRSSSVSSSGKEGEGGLREAKKLKDQERDKKKGRLTEAEFAETGSVKFEVYKNYFKMIGIALVFYVLISNIISNGATILSGLWLSEWSNDALDPIKVKDTELRGIRLGVYAGLGGVESIFLLSANLLVTLACIKASKLLHDDMLVRILRAPMSFFDTTPIGRILNRFSKDVDTADVQLVFSVRIIFIQTFRTVVAFAMVSLETPIILLAILPLAVIYYLVQRIYIATSRQLKRIDSTSRSPIYNHFSETVNGITSIRAFGATKEFIDESNRRVDANHMCYYPSFTALRWLSFRLEFLGFCIVFISALFAVISRNSLSPGIAGLAVSYSLNITNVLGMLVRCITDLETNIVSIERILEYTTTPTEAEWFIEETKPREDWPQLGAIRFHNYSTRYREGLDLILKKVTAEVKPNEKVGIVGRTGAGKSSLTLALFRIVEPAEGTIFIDDIDVRKLGLYDLRSRLTIIPQDPALFTGSLRMNLDPFDQYSDTEIWRALESAHLKDFVDNLKNGLSYEITEGGDNLSVGQKQLVCLARALLRRSKILVLDEATAAVDMETDDLIQETIRKEFASNTIVTIAHRLNTIIDYDRILVMDKGMVAEFDSPKALLANTQSIFYAMAKDANLVT